MKMKNKLCAIVFLTEGEPLKYRFNDEKKFISFLNQKWNWIYYNLYDNVTKFYLRREYKNKFR